ncbi:hypothetical protein FJTKL_09965 [Diaporthe vaccinii]|uniref:Uncharacterized protein n=1 Tax=Diaporthe vaccinii TaxID=105482 RepID=A0ABR4ELY1_9PEZI
MSRSKFRSKCCVYINETHLRWFGSPSRNGVDSGELDRQAGASWPQSCTKEKERIDILISALATCKFSPLAPFIFSLRPTYPAISQTHPSPQLLPTPNPPRGRRLEAVPARFSKAWQARLAPPIITISKNDNQIAKCGLAEMTCGAPIDMLHCRSPSSRMRRCLKGLNPHWIPTSDGSRCELCPENNTIAIMCTYKYSRRSGPQVLAKKNPVVGGNKAGTETAESTVSRGIK